MKILSRNYYRRQFYRLTRWAEQRMLSLMLVFALLVASLVVLWPRVFVVIPAGSVGVIYRPLSGGVDMEHLYREGFFLIWPWNKITLYNARIQLKELDLELLTADLLRTEVKVSFQFEVNPLTVPMLHKYVGENYLQNLIIPQVVAVTREKVAQFSSKMAYTGDMSQIANDIAISTDNLLIDKLSPPGLTNVRLIRLSSVQLMSVNYPHDVQIAIQNKVVEAEIAEAYKFKIEAAKREAERKAIEAVGIRDFQQIVNDNMTQNYLIFRGIQATEQLAQSANAKTLVFGSGPSGLPLILGNALDNPPVPAVPGMMPSGASSKGTPSSSLEAAPVEPASAQKPPLEPASSGTRPVVGGTAPSSTSGRVP